jgi:peptidoglycan hydrolase CwlO-like protein
MKYLLTLIFSISILSSIFSQRSLQIDTLPIKIEEYPAWFIHKSDTVGLILTIEQVQKIDSDMELLSWLEKKGFTCDSTISVYIKVIDEYKKQVTIFEVKISELNNQIIDKNSQIDNLKRTIENHEKEIKLSDDQIKKLNEVVTNSNKRIKN